MNEIYENENLVLFLYLLHYSRCESLNVYTKKKIVIVGVL